MLTVETKQKYNDLLMRVWKAVFFMDGPAPMADKEKWLPEFQRLLDEINSMVTADMTPNEILGGYQI
jgi:hypothetical protein